MKWTPGLLADYQRRHPSLFPGVASRPPAREAPDGYLPASVSNGYSRESEFQAALSERLRADGWTVHNSYLGSDGGGSAWMDPGFPDLILWRPEVGVVWLELKQPGNRPTPTQAAVHASLLASNVRGRVCWTMPQALEFVAAVLAP